MTGKIRKIWLLAAIALSALFLSTSSLAGCKSAAITETAVAETTNDGTSVSEETTANFDGQSLVISGSTTLLEVSNAWAEAFMAKYDGEITINGGGSGVGIADMINGANDLGNASRQIKDGEMQAAKDAGVDVKEYTILYDGISVVTSKNISIPGLTIQQLSDIYIGKITNWKEVGGPDAEIVAVARDSSSGTGEYFLERVVQLDKTVKDNDYGDTILRLQSNADVANQVSGNEDCIGYIGLGYLESIAGKANVVKVKEDKDSPAVQPTQETVKDKTYPISRGLFVYANGNKTSDIAKAFIEFMLSDEGQAIGVESGFVSLK